MPQLIKNIDLISHDLEQVLKSLKDWLRYSTTYGRSHRANQHVSSDIKSSRNYPLQKVMDSHFISFRNPRKVTGNKAEKYELCVLARLTYQQPMDALILKKHPDV